MPTEPLTDVTRERGALSDDAQRHIDFPLPWFEIHGFAARGWRTTILARETGGQTTSAAAAAIWFPYDAEPAEKVIAWALATFAVFRDLAADQASGVSMIELRVCAREGDCAIPEWAYPLGARAFAPAPDDIFASGYTVEA